MLEMDVTGEEHNGKQLTVDTLALVDLILRGPEPSSTEDNDDNILQSRVWFKQLKENIQIRQNNPFTVVAGNGRKLFVAQLFLILRECLLTHRPTEIANCLEALLNAPNSCRHTFHSVGSALLQHGVQDDGLLENLVNQVKVLRFVNGKKVVLEFLLYLLSKGEYREAKNSIQTFVEDGRRAGIDRIHYDYVLDLVKAYTGLVWYVEWIQAKRTLEARKQEQNFDSQARAEDILGAEDDLEMNRDRAMKLFEGLVHRPGLWDIFITKYVELLESINEVEKAGEILENYAEKNPDNPHTLLYLYEYHQRHQHRHSIQMTALQKYCDAVPSDELALSLYDNLMNEGADASRTLYLLFDMLDYFCWQTHVSLWSRLGAQLERICLSDDTTDHSALEKCWNDRASWWPKYHFDVLRVDADSTTEGLLKAKCIVAAILQKEKSYWKTTCSKYLGQTDKHQMKRFARLAKNLPIHQRLV